MIYLILFSIFFIASLITLRASASYKNFTSFSDKVFVKRASIFNLIVCALFVGFFTYKLFIA